MPSRRSAWSGTVLSSSAASSPAEHTMQTLVRSLLAAALVLATLAHAQGASDRRYIEHSPPPGGKALPFSDAVLSGNTLYVAGHLGLDPHTGSAPADGAAEAHLVLAAIKRTGE